MKSITKTNKQLRKFGLIFSGYFLFVVYLFSEIKKNNILPDFGWILFAIFVITYLSWPKFLLPLNIIWDGLLALLHWVNTRLLLGIIFFFLFSPIAFFRRILGKDILRLSYDKSLASYRESISENIDNDVRRPY